MPVANVVSWTAMIAGNAQHGRSAQAFQFFRRMILQGDPNSRPNQVTLLAILDACLSLTSKSAIATVRGLEALAAESIFHGDMMVNSALVNVYGSLGSAPDARRIFQSMPDRNVVSWSSMVAALAKCQRSGEAMATMRAMELEGIKASSVTLLAAIEACESSEDAGRIHARIVRDGFEGDTKLGNALVRLYGLKLGMIDRALEVFDRIQRKDAVSWGVAIDAWAVSGFPRESLVIFARMDLEGVLVEEVSFTLAIDACAAIPSLERGRMLHREMIEGDRCGVEEDLRLGNSLINIGSSARDLPGDEARGNSPKPNHFPQPSGNV
ncbi:pentatricopeptide repeat-containing protein At4g31070, mitochondrial-like [Selaginella moellendorffii]|uniref:pentatricopeptide repeat-containing protein At4g31070, mitochondrial-like n=1 Tax=Selaginella moellendorffii TaxID=88036 RepID=UPI000D1CD1C2|nr:pentatricopeptide repeat-containing protein At4g31070, mitochondrial-like [Selaginella moellendorffii]|eukprot:XP_024520360.1 pentatricopeptide repeat-containing protein At4g31070, mitochondrial-like [Selaginella moellendorffii]